MKNKKLFIFDEEKYAEEIIKKGFPNGVIDYIQMGILAKYLRLKFGYGAINLEKELIRFCKSQNINFNPITEAPQIKQWILSALKYSLRKVDSVSLSKGEINTIKNISDYKNRKLIFITLVISKALKKSNTRTLKTPPKPSVHYYVKYNNFLDIIRLSKFKLTEINLCDIFNKYPNLFMFYGAQKRLLRLNFVEHDFPADITITNIETFLELEYDVIFGGKSPPKPQCIKCKKEIIKTNNKQKYCKKCQPEVRREQVRKAVKKSRTNVIQ